MDEHYLRVSRSAGVDPLLACEIASASVYGPMDRNPTEIGPLYNPRPYRGLGISWAIVPLQQPIAILFSREDVDLKSAKFL